MKEMITSSGYFGVIVTLGAYFIGLELRKRVKSSLCNPLLVAIVILIVVLQVFKIDYDSYQSGAKNISYFLTPATICLAIPLYKQIHLLKKHVVAVVIAIFSGVIANGLSLLGFAMLFRFDHETYVSLLPKSITTAIGIGVTEELGGITTITIAAILVAGILGSIIVEHICKIFKITDPIAVGLAIGTSSHAMGTTRALEIGEIEGAMSSLAIAVAGLMTVVVAPIMAGFF